MKDEEAASRLSRAVISYVGGEWTDRLEVRYAGIDHASGAPRLVLEVVPARERTKEAEPFRRFLAKRNAVDSILLGKPPFRSEVQAYVRETERGDLSVVLRAAGYQTMYPASAEFGPDGITLTLG